MCVRTRIYQWVIIGEIVDNANYWGRGCGQNKKMKMSDWTPLITVIKLCGMKIEFTLGQSEMTPGHEEHKCFICYDLIWLQQPPRFILPHSSMCLLHR